MILAQEILGCALLLLTAVFVTYEFIQLRRL